MAAYDPQAEDNARRLLDDVHYCQDAYEAAAGADALILVTEWREFRSLDLARLRAAMRAPYFLDGRNLYEPATVRAAGFIYMGIGRGYPPQPFGGDIDQELYLQQNGTDAAADSREPTVTGAAF